MRHLLPVTPLNLGSPSMYLATLLNVEVEVLKIFRAIPSPSSSVA